MSEQKYYGASSTEFETVNGTTYYKVVEITLEQNISQIEDSYVSLSEYFINDIEALPEISRHLSAIIRLRKIKIMIDHCR